MYRIGENMSYSKFVITSALFFILFHLYKLETGKRSLSVVSYKFHNVDKSELFNTVTHADTVAVWFRWIKNFKSADQKPIGKGKHYYVFYNNEPILFKVDEYVPNSLIILESDYLLKPRIELRTETVGECTSRLTISMAFRHSSALFQMSMNPILQYVTREKLIEAVKYLKLMLKSKTKICKNNSC